MTSPARFTITFAAHDDADCYRALRWLLKVALRRFGLRCVEIRPAAENPDATP